MNYNDFILSKQHSTIDTGIELNWYPDKMFDYLKYSAEYLCGKGRAAGFFDTGTGKTILELTIAYNYAKHTNKPVLIMTPLAVAFQFIKEAEKFGINDVSYSKDGKYKTKIVICNYERLDNFDSNDFDCVILDESSILKNFKGAIKTKITSFLRKVKYRYLFTATPSPNDFIELGTSSEALGYMGYMDMLQKYFRNNQNNIRPDEIGNKWYLKPHAESDFFKWVSSWSLSMRKPSDIGFSDKKHILPKKIERDHFIKNNKNWIVNDQILMFGKIAKRQSEVMQEQRMTVEGRCEKAVELANNHDTSVYWCNRNDEGDLLEKLDSNSVQLKGSMKLDQKEEILIAFANGDIKKLITKAKMTGFGLNWQHCNHTVYFPTFSFEQYYQAIRRFWRFGQKENVFVDRVLSDGQKRVIDTLDMKTEKNIRLFAKLVSMMNQSYTSNHKEFNKEIIKPKFL